MRAMQTGLVKARIEIYNSGGKCVGGITCMFNPAEYSIKNSAAYAKKNELGKDDADYQFVHGESRELSVSLYFDTTDSGKDLDNIEDNEKKQKPVTQYTKAITALCRIEGTLHRPPTIGFCWGGLCFKGVLTSVGEQFTMFTVEGVPVRAKMDLVIAETYGAAKVVSSPPESPDRS